MKTCRKCCVNKPFSDYYKASSGTKDGYRHECKECWKTQCSNYFQENKETLKQKSKDWYYRTSYGLTQEDVKSLKDSYDNKCPVCARRDLVVDHCHTTGKVRGCLCNRCNQALGLLDEDVESMERLKDYMKNFLDKET